MSAKSKVSKKKNKIVSWTSLAQIRNGPGGSEYRRITYIYAVTTSAGGVYAVAFTPANVSGFTEWSSYAARYSQARVLALRIIYRRNYAVNVSATGPTAGGNLVVGTDRSGSVIGTPTSEIQVFALQNAKVFDVFTSWSYEARAIDIEDQLYSPTSGSPTATFAICVYGNGFNNTTTYGEIFVEAMVEFKGTR
jgi:hypothetical protein